MVLVDAKDKFVVDRCEEHHVILEQHPERHTRAIASFVCSADEPWILKFGPCRRAFSTSHLLSDSRASRRWRRAPMHVVA